METKTILIDHSIDVGDKFTSGGIVYIIKDIIEECTVFATLYYYFYDYDIDTQTCTNGMIISK